MELLKSEIQCEIELVVSRLMRERNTFTQLRSRLEAGRNFDRELWAAFAELGLLGVAFSEEQGGSGGKFSDAMVIAEALGKGLCLEPYTINVALCASLLQYERQHLHSLLSGEALFAFAHTEKDTCSDFATVDTRADLNNGSYLITGHKRHVLGGDVADRFLVSASTSGSGCDKSGMGLFIVDKDAAGLECHSYRNSDNMGVAELSFSSVPGKLLEIEGSVQASIFHAYDKATASVCAEAVGAMEALHEATVEYIKTRRQFNTTIGSFQVIQHKAVDLLVNLEHARSLSMVACRYADSDDESERSKMVSAAKIGVNNAARFVAKTALQLHGGIGMTEECAVGHYFRRLMAISLLFGDNSFHMDRLERLEAPVIPLQNPIVAAI